MSIELLNFSEADLRLYLTALVEIAHADDLHPKEKDFINLQSELVGIDPSSIWDNSSCDEADLLCDLPNQLKNILVRDAIALIYIDGKYTDEERHVVVKLAEQLKVDVKKVDAIRKWLLEYWHMLEEGEELFSE